VKVQLSFRRKRLRGLTPAPIDAKVIRSDASLTSSLVSARLIGLLDFLLALALR
jgi:hypothetical protein